MPSITATRVELPDISGVSARSDAWLIGAMRKTSEARRVVDSTLATLAGELAARSSRELGYDGLAQRSGAQTPEAFVAKLTGTSGADAKNLVTAGALMADPPAWMGEVAGLVADGSLSVGAAAAIRNGLGAPNEYIAADDLADAARALAVEASQVPMDQLLGRAKGARNELDQAGVADREQLARDTRYLRLTRQADGMTKMFGLLDPESAAVITGAIDAVTSPRRGGPRFVDPEAQDRVEQIVNDPRTIDQLSLDALVDVVRVGVKADDGTIFGPQKPAVRIHVKLSDLEGRNLHGVGAGVAWIEGQTCTVSVATAQRMACAEGYYPLIFDDNGAALNLGRAQRTFTWKQRIILAAIWGGCAVDGCSRPPSWTEAHHMNEWREHGGTTDVRNGILLCRHHHMLLHNNHWQILKRNGQLWMIPPPGDHAARPVRLISQNPIRQRT